MCSRCKRVWRVWTRFWSSLQTRPYLLTFFRFQTVNQLFLPDFNNINVKHELNDRENESITDIIKIYQLESQKQSSRQPQWSNRIEIPVCIKTFKKATWSDATHLSITGCVRLLVGWVVGNENAPIDLFSLVFFLTLLRQCPVNYST